MADPNIDSSHVAVTPYSIHSQIDMGLLGIKMIKIDVTNYESIDWKENKVMLHKAHACL